MFPHFVDILYRKFLRLANFFRGNFPARLDFLGEEFAAERKCSLFQLFLQLIWEIVAAPGITVWRRSGRKVIFSGEDGFIIKENFRFVKNGEKGGQKGQGEGILYVKHKEKTQNKKGGLSSPYFSAWNSTSSCPSYSFPQALPWQAGQGRGPSALRPAY